MKNEEINRAIAEHLGWSEIRQSECWQVTDPPEDKVVLSGVRPDGKLRAVPNFSSDLNAMHDALQNLTEVELFRYADEVFDLIRDGNHDTDIQTMLMLSAKELAECYVRAIGK